MRKAFVSILALAAAIGLSAVRVEAHCQIPCGIYDDELRVQLVEEHIGTVEKSMKQIVELSKAAPVDYNQLVRWVGNKEDHAEKIQEIVTAYFMAQRVKHPGSTEGDAYAKYVTQLTLLHQIQVAAMKAKQSTDLAHIATLRDLVAQFRVAYFGKEGKHSHM